MRLARWRGATVAAAPRAERGRSSRQRRATTALLHGAVSPDQLEDLRRNVDPEWVVQALEAMPIGSEQAVKLAPRTSPAAEDWVQTP